MRTKVWTIDRNERKTKKKKQCRVGPCERQTEMECGGCNWVRRAKSNHIKKHEISWSARNSPNYYNLANIQPADVRAVFVFGMPYLSRHNIFCRFPTLIYCFVCTNYFRSIYLSNGYFYTYLPTGVCLTFATSPSPSSFSLWLLFFSSFICSLEWANVQNAR